METEEYKWDIFLAHAGADLSAAVELYDWLKDYCRVFLDAKVIIPGDDWDHELASAQSESLITAVLISGNTGKAYYQREEIAAAIAMAREDGDRHRVVPIFLNPQEGINVPYGLRLKHGLYLSPESGFGGVATSLIDLLEQLRSRGTAERTGKQGTTPEIIRTTALQYASIKISQESGFWINGRDNPSRGDYVYPASIFDWAWRYEFDLKITALPEDADPSLEVTLMNTERKNVLVTGIGIEILSIGHISFSGASLPKAHKVPVTAQYDIEMPDLMPRFKEELEEMYRLGLPSISLEVNTTAWAQMQDDYIVEGELPVRFGLRLKDFGKRVPRFTLLRLLAETTLGQVVSENILFRRWM